MPETNPVVDLLSQLIATPSVNPVYDLGSPGERDVANLVEWWARDHGLRTERQPVLPGRDNVLVHLVVDPAAPTLLFEAHMDTVGVVPCTRGGFAPSIDGDRIYGRGSCDTKGSLATFMIALERLAAKRDELRCNVTLLAAVDEEVEGQGALTYSRSQPDIAAAIVGEPTSLRIVHGHKGVVRGAVTVTGRAAHTSVAHEGLNAIDAMADVLVGLRDISELLQGGLDGGSFTVSLIEGGSGVNVVPATCTIQYDRRTVGGETRTRVLAEIDAVLDRVRASRPEFTIGRPAPFLDVAALNTPPDAPVLRAAITAATSLGLESTPGKVPYGSDASYLDGIGGIPCLVLGPGSIDQAHGDDEFVPIPELEQAAALYEAIALHFGAPA